MVLWPSHGLLQARFHISYIQTGVIIQSDSDAKAIKCYILRYFAHSLCEFEACLQAQETCLNQYQQKTWIFELIVHFMAAHTITSTVTPEQLFFPVNYHVIVLAA